MSAINIQTNVGSIAVQKNLAVTARSLNQAIGRLSSGFRILSAADDPAGVAVAEGLNATLRGFQQAQRNANDAIAMLNTAEGAYTQISDILTRLRELAVQSANDSLTDTERAYMDTEFQQLFQEIDRIAAVTEYNSVQVLNGDGTGGPLTLTFQVGARNSTNDQIIINMNPQDTGTMFGGTTPDVTTLGNSQTAIDTIDAAFGVLATDRAVLGSTINKLSAATDNLGTTIENIADAKSRIKDADVAAESAAFTKSQVLMQSGVAMLAQANATPQYAMQLLQ